MYVYMHIYIYTYIHIHIYIYTCVCVHVSYTCTIQSTDGNKKTNSERLRRDETCGPATLGSLGTPHAPASARSAGLGGLRASGATPPNERELWRVKWNEGKSMDMAVATAN